jgi:glycosyltransferase involved in cell wall biosynthesis
VTIWVIYSNDPLAQDQGGGAEHFRGIYRALDRSGLEFRLIAARLQDERSDPRIEYVSRGSSFPRFWLALFWWFWRNRRRIATGDVVHVHRNYAAWPKLLLAPRRGRLVVTYHNVSGRVLRGWLGHHARRVRRLMLAAERRVARLADAIVCVSERDRRALARMVDGSAFAMARVIAAAFDAGGFTHRPVKAPTVTIAREVLVLGRLSRQKNVPLAITAFERAADSDPRWRLTIAGDGEDAAAIVARMAASRHRERIAWIGRVAHDRVPALIDAHGILLLTSRYEASPTVVKEALARHRAVVSTPAGDVRRWVEEHRSGLIAPAEPDALARALEEAARLIESGRYCPSAALSSTDERALMAPLLALYCDLSRP